MAKQHIYLPSNATWQLENWAASSSEDKLSNSPQLTKNTQTHQHLEPCLRGFDINRCSLLHTSVQTSSGNSQAWKGQGKAKTRLLLGEWRGPHIHPLPLSKISLNHKVLETSQLHNLIRRDDFKERNSSHQLCMTKCKNLMSVLSN